MKHPGRTLIRGAAGTFVVIALWVLLGCGGGHGGAPLPVQPDFGAPTGDGSAGSSDFGKTTLSPAQASGWSVETVDSAANIGWQTSIEVGVPASAPLVHISYYEQAAKDLKLASGFQGGPWTLSTLDAPFDVGRYNSIAGGAVSYYQAFGKLKAWRPAGPGPEVVDPQADLGAFNDIAVGDGGELHVSYVGTYIINNLNKRSQVRHAVFNGATWSTEVVDDGPANAGSFSFSSIAEDADGTYHISYRGQTGRLKRAFGNTGAWTIEEVLPGNPMTSNVGQTSILADFAGAVHIFYSKSGTGGGLYHASNTGSGWNVELVALGFGIMTPSSAVQDLLGTLRVAAYKSNTRDLVLFTSGSWTSVTTDSAGDVGKYAALAVDSQNCLHISYVRDDASDDLKYATNWQDGGCLPSEVWVDDDWAETSCGTEVEAGKVFCDNAFAVIQDGVRGVSAGGTVHVAPGIYHETVSIGKPGILVGDGYPVIDGSGSAEPVVWVKSSDVTVEGFEITNPTGQGTQQFGVLVGGVGPITGVEIINDRIQDITGSDGAGVYIKPGSNPTIKDSFISAPKGKGPCYGILGDSAAWTSGVSKSVVFGGTCDTTTAIQLYAGTPLIEGNSIIFGGIGLSTVGVDVSGTANPKIRANKGIDGGTAEIESVGIEGRSSSWTDEVSFNTISGGTCFGCISTGIRVRLGSPSIEVENQIAGGSGSFTRGIYVTYHGNPTIDLNYAVNGGFATARSIGILGDSADWNSTVSRNNMSGGICTGCSSFGIRLFAGTPTIGPNNEIDGGTGEGDETIGIHVGGLSSPTITDNSTISGGTGTITKSAGIYGDTPAWNSVVSGNSITGGSCMGCSSRGIVLEDGTPQVGPGNTIDGGMGKFTTGIQISSSSGFGNPNPTITGNTSSITGGNGTDHSIGIYGFTASWVGTVSSNTISGGTCTGCFSYGIALEAGTPTIGPSNNIDGGSGGWTRGIGVFGTANPTIAGNASTITGGTATVESVGIYGALTATWTGTVSGNTISGGQAGDASRGIRLDAGTPTITQNTIDGGTAGHSFGIYHIVNASAFIGVRGAGNTIKAGGGQVATGVYMTSTPANLTDNAITGAAGGGFDVEDRRLAGSGCIGANATKTSFANGDIDDSGVEIWDPDLPNYCSNADPEPPKCRDFDVEGPFTIGNELKILNGGGNCIYSIDTSL